MERQRLLETLKFVLKLVFTGLLFQAVIYLEPDTYWLQTAFASLIGFLLTVTGFEVAQEGIRLITDEAVYVVVQDCLGWKSMAAFIALTWASAERLRDHVEFLLTGLGMLFLANLVRVYSTVTMAEAGIVSFDVVHDFLWRWSLTGLVLVAWAYWYLDWSLLDRLDENSD